MTITFVGASAAGAGPNGVNASLSPVVPAGVVAGDLVMIFATIRNVGAGVVDTPPGWTRMLTGVPGNMMVLGRFWLSTDTMPTITFTGGVALADTTSATLAFRGVAPDLLAPNTAALTNVSAQNVAYPGLAPGGSGRVIITGGWKQGIATTWDTPAGYTSLGLTSVAGGSGASIKWSYLIETTAVSLPAGSAILTGGAANVSQGFAISLRPAASLTATAVATVYPPRVLLTATGLDVGATITINRIVAGQRTPVRGANALVTTAATLVVVDAEIPFGVPVTYALTIVGDDSTTTAVTYTLPGGKVAITDAITATAAEVVILSWPAQDQDAVSTVFVVDRRNIVVNGGLAQYRSTIDLFTDTTAGGDQLDRLLNACTSGIVQIRQPGGYDGVDGYAAILGASKNRWSQDGSDPRRIWTIDVAEVDGWPGALLARGFTYQDVINKYASLRYLNWTSDYATYLAAQQGDYS